MGCSQAGCPWVWARPPSGWGLQASSLASLPASRGQAVGNRCLAQGTCSTNGPFITLYETVSIETIPFASPETFRMQNPAKNPYEALLLTRPQLSPLRSSKFMHQGSWTSLISGLMIEEGVMDR